MTATVTNYGRLSAKPLSVQANVPDGWTAQATSAAAVPALAPGSSSTVIWPVTPPSLTPGQTYDLGVTVSYGWPRGKTSMTVTASQTFTAPFVARYASLAQAFNNVGITDDSNPSPGDFDGTAASGNGDSYSAQALAAVGVTPGSTVTYNGTTFTWPDVPAGTADNVAGGAPSIAMSGSGSALAFLEADANSNPGTMGAITYADGTVQFFDLSSLNWTSGDAQRVFYANYRNTPSGPANFGGQYGIFYRSVPLQAGKQVAVVTLPQSSSVHLFAMAIKP